MENPTARLAPSKKEIEEIRARQKPQIHPPEKTIFTGKNGEIWRPWCINHIAMALGDCLPTARDPLHICRVIAIRVSKHKAKAQSNQKPDKIECFVCEKHARFWMTQH